MPDTGKLQVQPEHIGLHILHSPVFLSPLLASHADLLSKFIVASGPSVPYEKRCDGAARSQSADELFIMTLE